MYVSGARSVAQPQWLLAGGLGPQLNREFVPELRSAVVRFQLVHHEQFSHQRITAPLLAERWQPGHLSWL